MPWTIPNLILHDKPVRLANMRSHGRKHVFVNCGNPDCYHNAANLTRTQQVLNLQLMVGM